MEADIAGFITIGLVVAFIAGQVFRTLRTHSAQKTLREAISRGVPVTPEMLMEAEKAPEAGANDLALAIVGFGLIQGSTDAIKGSAGIALFPLFVGIALLLRLRLNNTQGDA
jgi:hypothetical protein